MAWFHLETSYLVEEAIAVVSLKHSPLPGHPSLESLCDNSPPVTFSIGLKRHARIHLSSKPVLLLGVDLADIDILTSVLHFL